MVVRIADTPVSDKEERLTVDTAVGTGGDKPLAQIGKNCYLSPDINFLFNGWKIEAFCSVVRSRLVFIKL